MTGSYHFQIEPEPRVEITKGTFEVHADGSVSGVGPHGDSFHYTALQIAFHSGGLEGYIIGLTYGGYTRRESIPFPSGATLTTSGDKIVGRVEAVSVCASSGSSYTSKTQHSIVVTVLGACGGGGNSGGSATGIRPATEPIRPPLDWNTTTPHDTFGADFIVTKGAEPTSPLYDSPTTDSAYPAIAGLLRG